MEKEGLLTEEFILNPLERKLVKDEIIIEKKDPKKFLLKLKDYRNLNGEKIK